MTATYRPHRDPSLIAILIGNMISIYLAYTQSWPLAQIMWIYWGQSVVIGISNFVRIWTLKEFSTKNFTMNDEPVPETPEAKKQVATFFAIHYGLFHLGYAVFLWQERALSDIPFCRTYFDSGGCQCFLSARTLILSCITAGMILKRKKPNIGTLMFYPYLRILPMHLVIVFGGIYWKGWVY